MTMLRMSMIAAALFATSTVSAGGTESWNFDVATEGEDLFWTSPTSVDTEAPRYDMAYEITLVEVTVRYLIFDIVVDVTKDIPPEFRTGSQIIDGPPPIVLFQGQIDFPGPPDPPALAADMDLSIDKSGFGQLSLTNIVFGQLEVEVPPFGVQTVDLQAIHMVGQVDVTPLGPAEDVNADGVVDFQDILLVLGAWGLCPDPPETCPEDVNGDGAVDFQDILRILGAWS